MARVNSTAWGSTSRARIGAGAGRAASRAWARIQAIVRASSDENEAHRSNPMRGRNRPGATRQARIAASIARVPDPHIGSTNGLSGSHFARRRIAAASVSFSGASSAFAR